MARTADYTRKAINNYRSKFDLVQIRLPKGTKDRAAESDININDIAVSAVLAYLDALESQTENLPQEPEKTAEKANTECTEVEEKVTLMQAMKDCIYSRSKGEQREKHQNNRKL